MNTPTRLAKFQKRNRGIALIIVVSMVAILTVMTVAMLTLSDSERKSSVKYSNGENASTLADMAVNIVMGQLWDGTNHSTTTTGGSVATSNAIWASQPGAIRKYTPDGKFYAGYKLYSSDKMLVGTGQQESAMASDSPDTTWKTLPDQWVDLNEPSVRPDPVNPNDITKATVTFPIMDPQIGRASCRERV